MAGELVSSLSLERTSSCAAKRKSSSALSLGIIEALSFPVLFSSSLSTPSAVVILLTVALRFRTLLLSAFGPASHPKFVTRLGSSSQFGIYEISGKILKIESRVAVDGLEAKAALDGGVGKGRHKKV